MKRLIVNADDFGMTEAVDLGIAKAHREGIVTSASFLACGESAEHAARVAAENPGLGVGVHLCLTMLTPVSDPSSVRSITSGGAFLGWTLPFMARFTFGLADRREVEAELRAQIRRAFELGIRPTHLDGHQHIHVMPGVFPIVAGLASEFGIGRIRYPVGPWTGSRGPASFMEKLILEGIAKSQRGHILHNGLKHPDSFFGLSETGRLDADAVIRIINQMPDGTSELMCHPGIRDDEEAGRFQWGYGWQTELAAVTNPHARDLLSDEGIELVSYKSL